MKKLPKQELLELRQHIKWKIHAECYSPFPVQTSLTKLELGIFQNPSKYILKEEKSKK